MIIWQDAGLQSITTFGYQTDILINTLLNLKKTYLIIWKKNESAQHLLFDIFKYSF